MLLSDFAFSSDKQADDFRNVNKKAGKILFVCTSISNVNEKPNGTFLSEIAILFIIFHEQGYEIDIVSPKGGVIPICFKFDTTEVISRALNSEYYINKISHSLTPEQVNPNDYIAVIIPGGYGQFWDIHTNSKMNILISQIYENKGFIGALGQGTSTLVNLKLKSGEYFVKDKTLTCFPSWFEKEIMTEANFGKLLPFDMELKLKERGANLKPVDKETFSNGQIIDIENRLVTASFADGGLFIATIIHKLIEESPKK
jgi:putative intracellular protease/amidase